MATSYHNVAKLITVQTLLLLAPVDLDAVEANDVTCAKRAEKPPFNGAELTNIQVDDSFVTSFILDDKFALLFLVLNKHGIDVHKSGFEACSHLFYVL